MPALFRAKRKCASEVDAHWVDSNVDRWSGYFFEVDPPLETGGGALVVLVVPTLGLILELVLLELVLPPAHGL